MMSTTVFEDGLALKEYLMSRESQGLWGRPMKGRLNRTCFARRFGKVWWRLELPSFLQDRYADILLRPAGGIVTPRGGSQEEYFSAVSGQFVYFKNSNIDYDQINAAAEALAAKIGAIKATLPEVDTKVHFSYKGLDGADALAAWRVRAREVVLDILKGYTDLHGNLRSCTTKSLFGNLWHNYNERPCYRPADAYRTFYHMLLGMAKRQEIYRETGDVKVQWAFRPESERECRHG